MVSSRVAIVTGAASGIGRAIAVRFKEGGFAVIAVDKDEIGLEKLSAAKNDELIPLAASVDDSKDLDRVVEFTASNFGRLDSLLQIAGVGCYAPLWEVADEEIERVIKVNAVSQMLLAKRCIVLLRATEGAVVNMASVRAFRGGEEMTVYSASKAAIIGMTRSMAHEFGPKVRVNALCPGTIDTPLLDVYASTQPDSVRFKQSLQKEQPLGRIGTPDDVAEAAFYLGTASSRFITGTTLTVDGGLTA